MHTTLQHHYLRGGRRLVAERFGHNKVCGKHDHDIFEIALVVQGQCIHDSELGRQSIGIGNAVILRPGGWHAMYDAEELVMFNCLFSPALLSGPLQWALDDPEPRRLLQEGLEPQGVMVLRLPPGGSARCEALFERLPRLTDPEPARSEYPAIATLLLALAELARGTPITTEHASTALHDPTHPAITKAARLLRTHPSRRWTIDDLASAVGLSGPYLVRRFASEMGVSPIAYLARLRAEYAAAELIRSEKSVLEIGLDTGWPEPKHFARRFKEHFGISATEYRKRFARGT